MFKRRIRCLLQRMSKFTLRVLLFYSFGLLTLSSNMPPTSGSARTLTNKDNRTQTTLPIKAKKENYNRSQLKRKSPCVSKRGLKTRSSKPLTRRKSRTVMMRIWKTAKMVKRMRRNGRKEWRNSQKRRRTSRETSKKLV